MGSLHTRGATCYLSVKLPWDRPVSFAAKFAQWHRNAENQSFRGRLMINDDLDYIWELMNMAKKPSAGVNNDRVDWIGFADVSLSDDDRAFLREEKVDFDTVLEGLQEVIATGHKVAFSKKPDKPSYVCSFTGATQTCKNAGVTLSSFAPDVLAALRVNLYKHFRLAKGDYTTLRSRTSEDFG